MTPNETPTPRTDAVAFDPNAEINPICVEAEFARQLERELAEVKKDVEESKELLHATGRGECDSLLRRERDELRAKLQAAEAACAEMRQQKDCLQNGMVNIANLFGVITPLQLIAAAKNNEETYVDILFCIIKEQLATKDAHIAELEQQLAEARKDSERLDWLVELSKTQEGVEILGPFDGDDIWTVGTMEHSHKGFKTLRESIDNAKGDA